MKFELISYSKLNSRQKENFNFQKVSAVLAEYGFNTIKLSDDWQGADFIAHHIDGDTFLKVQLKGRLTVETKYKDKEIWICFRYRETWYLYPHDEFLRWGLSNLRIGKTSGWKDIDSWNIMRGAYSWPYPSKKILSWLDQYALNAHLGSHAKGRLV